MHRVLPASVVSGLLVLLLLTGSHAVQAATASANATLANPYDGNEQRVLGPTGVQVEYALAVARSGYGFGKVVARANVEREAGPGDLAGDTTALAVATSSFVDRLLIKSSPELEGTLGVLWFDTLLRFQVRQELDSRNAAFAGASASLSVLWFLRSPNTVFIPGGCQLAGDTGPSMGLLCDKFTFEVEPDGSYTARMRAAAVFFFGQQFDLGLQLTGSSEARLNLQQVGSRGSVLSWLEAGQSVYWDGIADITTLDNVSVDYTVSALSGADYRVSFAPVPEPSTWLLSAAGLVVLLPRLLRRRAENLRTVSPKLC